MSTRVIQPPSEIIQKWQEMVNLLAEVIRIPAALVMKVEPPSIKVLVSSESNGNPYERDEVASLNTGLYCETVMKTRQSLLVPDALVEEEWKSNPDIERGMISYLGFPITWPDGEIFGTICVLDSKKNEYGELNRKLLQHCRDVLQADLSSLAKQGGELTTQKAYLDELFDQAPEGIVLLDVEDRVLRVNREFTRMFGYTFEEAVGRPVNDLIAPEELRREAEEYTDRIIHGKPVNTETIRRRKDGRRIHVSLLAVTVSIPGEGQIAEYAIYRDISERKRAEEALRRNEGYLAEAQRLTRCGSWAWNVLTQDVSWSQEMYRIFDYEPGSLKPTVSHFLERVHPDDRPLVEKRARIESSQKEVEDSEGDFRIVLTDGQIKYLHSIAHPVANAAGEIAEVIGTTMDMTEHYKARAALETAFEQIKALKDQLHEENIALREEIDRSSMFEEIVGESSAVQAVLARVAKVAPADSTVLITGETGTGKELIARAIHKRSQRATRAFVSVNCAAIPSSLIASELFGHEKGAFTGALQRRLGRFELAEGGTIFLDEIGELPAETQIALLRVLQEREFERVGGNKVIHADVRVIAATNRDLQTLIEDGAFRSDLFYRLNVFPVELPPLRKRPEDIPLLAHYFIDRFANKAGKKISRISRETLDTLKSYPWPGNVRELQNVIERSVIVCDTEIFSVDESWLSPPGEEGSQSKPQLLETTEVQEKKIIEEALERARGRVAGPSGAAAKLGLPPSTLDSKIRAHKINKHRFKSL
jgi:PAS domain S-box-containing protein